MRDYELLFIVKPDRDEEQVNAAVEKVKGLITNNGGEMVEENLWGKRKLAYTIDKKWSEGIYVLFNFKGTTETVDEINRVMKITDDYLRQMIVAIEE